jgi:hypothetical protein
MYFHTIEFLGLLLTLASGSLGSRNPITSSATLHPLLLRQAGDPASCDLVNSIAGACSASTVSFFDQPFSVAATCLCYSGSIYQPSIFDGAVETCLDYLSTASPPLYTSLAGSFGTGSPCSLVGDVRTNTLVDYNLVSCSSWYSMEASCSSDDIASSAPPFSVQASCLCYTSSVFAPTVFDGYWDGCLEYYKTASSEYYYETLSNGNLNTPCARVGDVRAISTTSPSSTITSGQTAATIPGATISSTSSTSIPQSTTVGNGACSSALPCAWCLVVAMALPLGFSRALL